MLGKQYREYGDADLFVFHDTIEGPRAPAVKPGRVNLALRELGRVTLAS